MKPQSQRFVSRITRDTLALILAGGRGSRLKQLTQWRAKPAVPFGGKFRIIDFPLSNCINSGIRQVGVITQYKAHSLIQHVQRGWSFLRGEFGEFIELWPAQQRIETSWYKGTADAVFQNLDIIRDHDPSYVLILAGDHIYKMDYGDMIAYHVESGADMTVGCLEVDLDMARGFGVMGVDADGRVERFDEKPEHPQPLPGKTDKALASMGIYVFNKDFLFQQLVADADTPGSSHDFGKDIIPKVLQSCRVMAYPFRDVQTGTQAYWRDVGTIDSYWKSNLELIGVTPELNLYDMDWPIWTYQEQLPPAKFVFDDDDRRGMAVDSMVSGGCIISGSLVRHSLLFSNVTVNSYAQVTDSVILPDVDVGRNCVVHKAVIDKGCRIPEGMVIGRDREQDAKRFYVSDGGVTVVTPDMLGNMPHHGV
ncbi:MULTISPECIES: glucose-1-phosphate adenylyltransferase [unclassified Ectothiorhodospira]|jgi:glucose-1-phosphate adenylyltransferase|uniref:glucose-1-phosphate adenylyltransferase n=1 Tax=unclassified Ectothiorhodospira TaxID=2684909 RepID=UPI001EE97098|nr:MULTISPECIES: glucose-1-phosphate adenylyltransferase [unclassified Ectothiorhodospira]MCG5516012.1 glucose-1-phosphate adenylyltransferase [Ectothiorhodospira sp. 9100]MCG5519026.1 glucose-1-phosphate adenylyltransferase [Ectothiorhodospira sp. 9905]